MGGGGRGEGKLMGAKLLDFVKNIYFVQIMSTFLLEGLGQFTLIWMY